MTLKTGSEYRVHVDGRVTVEGDAEIETGSSVLVLNILAGSMGSARTFTILTVGGRLDRRVCDSHHRAGFPVHGGVHPLYGDRSASQPVGAH